MRTGSCPASGFGLPASSRRGVSQERDEVARRRQAHAASTGSLRRVGELVDVALLERCSGRQQPIARSSTYSQPPAGIMTGASSRRARMVSVALDLSSVAEGYASA